MKLKLIIFLALLFCEATLSQAQTFKKLVEKADAFRKIAKLDSADEYYYQAINLVLENKEKVDQHDWISTLSAAADVSLKRFSSGGFSSSARQYWGMAYGTLGETLDEKIAFLKDYGVKDLIVYHSYDYTVPYVIGGCSTVTTKYLIWIKSGKTYIQKFDNCSSYKPLIIAKSAIAAFYPAQKEEIVKGKLTVFKRVFDAGDYDLTFIDQTGELKRTKFYAYDLIKPDGKEIVYPTRDIEKEKLGYEKNINSSLGKFIKMLWSDLDQYEGTLTSGTMRGKVGDF